VKIYPSTAKKISSLSHAEIDFTGPCCHRCFMSDVELFPPHWFFSRLKYASKCDVVRLLLLKLLGFFVHVPRNPLPGGVIHDLSSQHCLWFYLPQYFSPDTSLGFNGLHRMTDY
jgi:hypothetical protein